MMADATKLGKAKKAYPLIFLDPPYFKKMIEPALKGLYEGGWIAKDGLVIVEHDAKEQVTLPEAFELLDERRYGRAVVKLIKLV
jgi:16S rRNA (guanine966-N2)-methyltransferase